MICNGAKASGGLELLQMVLEPNTERCAGTKHSLLCRENPPIFLFIFLQKLKEKMKRELYYSLTLTS